MAGAAAKAGATPGAVSGAPTWVCPGVGVYEGPGAMWNIEWADWTKRSFSLA